MLQSPDGERLKLVSLRAALSSEFGARLRLNRLQRQLRETAHSPGA